jgi:glycosyltransferase involved in cell wall biosynthesis
MSSSDSTRLAPGNSARRPNLGPRSREIWVAGYPGTYGGASTELDHQIDLWLSQGVSVHMVPDGEPYQTTQANLAARGATTHKYRPDIFAGKVVVSFCNGTFLKRLPDIFDAGRPRLVIWVNCMTWTFPYEIEYHRRGLIDLFAFQSNYQRLWLLPELRAVRPVQELEGYRPFFSMRLWSDRSLSVPPSQAGFFGIGRISRDDWTKYPADFWMTASRVRAPHPIKFYVLGWGPNALRKCGLPQESNKVDFTLWPPRGVPAQQFFEKVHIMMHQTGEFRENWPHVTFEAWASQVAVIAECDYGWPEVIDDGETGILCRTSRELAQCATELAFDEGRRKRITTAALQRLKEEHCSVRRSFAAWDSIL